MAKRDPNYTCNKTGKALGALTTDETGSLLEEILIQRRLELWGEDGRIMTIRRLRQGFQRAAEDGWHSELLLTSRSLNDPESYPWVLTIPITEISGNPNMNLNEDQNPIGDYAESHATGPQNVSFVQAVQEVQTPKVSQTIAVPIKRATTQGVYYAQVKIVYSDDMSSNVRSTSTIVRFEDGKKDTTINVSVSNMELGHDYYVDLTLSDDDVANSSPSMGATITSTRVVVHCVNGDPAGQQISFLTESFEQETSSIACGFSVPLSRAITTNEYRATVEIEDIVGDISLDSHAVIFNVGASSASVWLFADGMAEGDTYSCVLKLSSADVATGGEITSIRVTVKREGWTDIGTVNYNSSLLGEYSIRLQQKGDSGYYRFVDFMDEGFNISFNIDDDNKVYIEPQPCWDDSSTGLIYMRGYANSDASNYAGTFDPDTRLVSMRIKYYVPNLGSYPVSTDEFYLP